MATEPGYPGKLALQYWFFYAFNDFNNTHEGDWEMIQLVFDAADAAEALDERAGRGRLQLARGRRAGGAGTTTSSSSSTARIPSSTRPPARTRTSSREALYLGSSAEAGRRLRRHARPAPRARARSSMTIPSDPAAAATAFPWITFEGRWGELQKAFFNGPTGPNMKTQWTEPIEWSEDWRDRSYAVPTGGVLRDGRHRLLLQRRREGLEAR